MQDAAPCALQGAPDVKAEGAVTDPKSIATITGTATESISTRLKLMAPAALTKKAPPPATGKPAIRPPLRGLAGRRYLPSTGENFSRDELLAYNVDVSRLPRYFEPIESFALSPQPGSDSLRAEIGATSYSLPSEQGLPAGATAQAPAGATAGSTAAGTTPASGSTPPTTTATAGVTG